MKTIKNFNYNQLFVYKEGRPKLAGQLTDLLKPDHVVKAFYAESTESTRGYGQSALFFEEDVLNLPNQIWYFGWSWGPDMPTDFIQIPIQYEGQQYDAWVTVNKFNVIFTQIDREELERVLPKYFSDKPDKKLGFFSESKFKFTESIQRNFTSDDQIREIMENPDLSLEEKSRRMFDRSPEHVFNFGMCRYRITDVVRDMAEKNGKYNTYNSEAREYILDNESGTSPVACTYMCGSDQNELLDVQTSYDHYVLRQEHYGKRAETTTPLRWWKYLKICIEGYEQGVGYKNKKLGFFGEDMNMKLDLLHEEIDNDWLKRTYGIEYDQLEEFAEHNFEEDWDVEIDYYDQYYEDWNGTGIVSPWYDDCGIDHFHNFHEICEYYGEDWVKNWIDGFIEWLAVHKIWKRQTKLGFFNN